MTRIKIKGHTYKVAEQDISQDNLADSMKYLGGVLTDYGDDLIHQATQLEELLASGEQLNYKKLFDLYSVIRKVQKLTDQLKPPMDVVFDFEMFSDQAFPISSVTQQHLQTQQRYVKEKQPQPGKPMPKTKKPAGKLKKWLLTLMNFPEEAIREAVLVEAVLKANDKQVVRKFLNKQQADGGTLRTNGRVLEITGLGGAVVAKWEAGKIVLLPTAEGSPSSRFEQSIIRFLKKNSPKNWIAASCGRKHSGKQKYNIPAQCIADLYGLTASGATDLVLENVKGKWLVNGRQSPMSDGEAAYLIQECVS